MLCDHHDDCVASSAHVNGHRYIPKCTLIVALRVCKSARLPRHSQIVNGLAIESLFGPVHSSVKLGFHKWMLPQNTSVAARTKKQTNKVF